MEMTPRSSSVRAWGWVVLFGLAALEALAATVYLVSLPADAENAIFLGFSTRRLALIGILLALCAGTAALAWFARKPAWRASRLEQFTRGRTLAASLLMLLAGFTGSLLIPIILMSLYRSGGDFRYYAYFERLLPLIAWTGLFCLQTIFWLGWVGSLEWQSLRIIQASFRAGLVIFGLFGAAWIFIALTRIGITPDLIGWGDPSVPLLEWQIWLAWLAGSLFLLYLLSRRWPAKRDWFLAGAIWLLACGLWLAQPIRTAYFATPGRAPNYEIYPFSDGAYYGLFAQSLLIGNGFQGDQVPPRPLYISLLASFHELGGQGYEQVIALQTLLLAFFPVGLYFIGKELHSRPAGLVIALMAILREVTAITTVAITNKASTSQLFFADLPSALAISLWALLAIKWLKSSGQAALPPLLMGGAMGIAMLFRTQSIFMLPLTLFLALFAFRLRWRIWLPQFGWALLGLVLALAPWLWRNWQITGQLAFDDPKTQTGVMAQRYDLSEAGPDDEFVIQPGETLEEYSNRVNQGLIGFMLAKPHVVIGFLTAHTLNSEIDNLLLLPVRSGLSSPEELIMPSQPFWEDWSGAPSAGQMLLMGLNLAIIALGVGSTWARLRWAGLVLLLANFAYNGSNALARNSGWRYLLPVDWMAYVYAGLGLMEITLAVLLILGISPASLVQHLAGCDKIIVPRRRTSWHSWGAGFVAGAVLVLVGGIPVLFEHAIPKRYLPQPPAALAEKLDSKGLSANPGYTGPEVEKFLAQPGALIIEGRALYPRFYPAGDGEPRTAKAGYEPLDFPRILFLIASNEYYGLVMVRADQPPDSLPNASDVIVLGCMQEKYLDAYAVLVTQDTDRLFLSHARLPEQCQTEPGTIP